MSAEVIHTALVVGFVVGCVLGALVGYWLGARQSRDNRAFARLMGRLEGLRAAGRRRDRT